MPAIITATQLRNVLGVSSALYDDTSLNQIIDSAENIILPMLVSNSFHHHNTLSAGECHCSFVPTQQKQQVLFASLMTGRIQFMMKAKQWVYSQTQSRCCLHRKLCNVLSSSKDKHQIPSPSGWGSCVICLKSLLFE